jgi:hypothetical protein
LDGSIASVFVHAEPVAVLAGGGALPSIVAAAATRNGRPVLVIAIRGEADHGITAFPHRWVDWGDVGGLLSALRAHRARELIMVGRIGVRPNYEELELDRVGRFARRAITRIFRGGDNSVLSGAVRLFESRGFRIIGAHEVARELVASAGWMTRTQGIAADIGDGDQAFSAAKAIGAMDIGQAAVAIDGRIVALEGAEGTDGMLERVASLRRSGKVTDRRRSGVLAKCAKPHQDLRVDMPTIGPETVAAAAAAGLAGIVIEAGRVMIAERETTIRRADGLGLFMQAKQDEAGD